MKLFPLHLIPNNTRIDFMRWRWLSAPASGRAMRPG